MNYLGMFTLGAFVGGLLTLGIDKQKTLSEYTKLITTVLGAAFSGVVMGFIGYLGNLGIGDAIFMYPVGLLMALLWFYSGVAMNNIRSDKNNLRALGYAHMAALVMISLLVMVLLSKPVVTDMWGAS
ncbi:MAG: hypothetical protein AAGM16_14165 [Pseudomonadota bacterium]